jgi:hypothetical protein
MKGWDRLEGITRDLAGTAHVTVLLGHATAAMQDGATALAAVAGPVPEAIEALRGAAGPATERFAHRIHAASVLREVAGDAGPLLAAIRDGLGRQRDHRDAARAARSIEDQPEWLVPALQAALAASGVDQNARAELARTLCRFAADTRAVLPVMTELLRQDPQHLRRGPVGEYALLEAACELGPAAEPLRQIRLLDQAVVSPDVRERLRDAAERPDRVVASGRYGDIIRADEALRRMIRDFLNEDFDPA